jgi:hypothetical protein
MSSPQHFLAQTTISWVVDKMAAQHDLAILKAARTGVADAQLAIGTATTWATAAAEYETILLVGKSGQTRPHRGLDDDRSRRSI